MLTKATVIGAGAMGTVIADVLASNNINVALWGRRPEFVAEMIQRRENRTYLPGLRLSERIRPTADARAALANTELVIAATPCQHIREVWGRLAGDTPADATICSVAKGIEAESLRPPSRILEELLPGRPMTVLSGPSIAAEIARRLPATVVVAGHDPAAVELVQQALSTEWFRVYTNDDVIGVELGGALKNVVALAAGILDGLKAGDNAKAALVTRGLVEITRLGVAMGARTETFGGLAGIGDLVTTCVSPLGRNRTAGERIGRGESAEAVLASSSSVIEGIPSARAVRRLAERHGVEMPITEAVCEVLFEGKPALMALTELMSRPPKSESVRSGRS